MPRDLAARKAYHTKYLRDRYRNDPEYREKHKARTKRCRQRARKKLRAAITEWKQQGCQLCSERTEVCLDAHHRDPEKKEFDIGRAVGITAGIARLLEELEKCACLCSNCHRKVHAGLLSLRGGLVD